MAARITSFRRLSKFRTILGWASRWWRFKHLLTNSKAIAVVEKSVAGGFVEGDDDVDDDVDDDLDDDLDDDFEDPALDTNSSLPLSLTITMLSRAWQIAYKSALS